MVLEAEEARGPAPLAGPAGPLPEGVFAVEGDSVAELRAGLASLASATRATGDGIGSAAGAWLRARPAAPEKKLGLALVARTGPELGRLIGEAEATLSAARERRGIKP